MAKSSKEELKYLEGKLKQNPDSILFARLADIYLSMNRIDEAIQLCEHGIKKHPYYVTGHYIMGKCYLQKKQFEHAEKELKRVLLFDPQYIAAHRDYGDLMAQIGWHSTFESSYQKILEIDPFNTLIKKRIENFKDKFQLQEDIKEEFDTELGEFDEEAFISKESIDMEERKKEVGEDLESLFPEKKTPAEPITEDEEEKFSYILEDIFKDDTIRTTQDSEQKEPTEPVKEQPQFTIKEPAEHESSTEQDDFSSQWLDIEELAPIQSLDSEIEDKADKKDSKKFESSTPEESQGSDDLEQWLDKGREPEPIRSHETEFDEKKEDLEQKSNRKKEKIVTPTLGEIYAAQHQYAKAIGVYEILKKNNPDNPIYEQKIEYLKKKLAESQNLEK